LENLEFILGIKKIALVRRSKVTKYKNNYILQNRGHVLTLNPLFSPLDEKTTSPDKI